MKQKIPSQKIKDTNSFELKAVKTAQSIGKQIIPALYRKALAETFWDIKTLEEWLKKMKTENKKSISITLGSGETLEDLTSFDIENIIQSIRERAKIKSLFYIQEYLAKKVNDLTGKNVWPVESTTKDTKKKTEETKETDPSEKKGIIDLDDLTYEETSDIQALLSDKNSFFDDIQTMIRNYSISEVRNIIDKEIAERKMHFVDLLEGYKQLPYVLDLDRKINDAKEFILDIRMKSYFEWKKDIDYKQERIINLKLSQIEEFEVQKKTLLEDKTTWSKELAIVYRLEQLKEYRRQFEEHWFVMLPSRQKIYDEILEEVLNGNSVLITWHTGTGKTVLAVRISKKLQKKYFENFIMTDELFDEITNDKEYISLLASALWKSEENITHILWLDTNDAIDEKHKKALIQLIKNGQKNFSEQIKKKMEEIKNDPQQTEKFEKLTKALLYNPIFVEVLSGNSWMTVGEISAKLGLEGDGKGGTRTTTQMGKLLKAMSQGKLPIFDEINLVPTDTIMRTKHIFTLKPGEAFSPQEGQGEIIEIKNPSVVATGNLWSKYERNKIDPAVLRLLWGIEATYFDRNETYDLALVSLMDKEGFITGVDKWFLIGKQAPLVKLIEALKSIEDNYMGKGTELQIDNKKDNWLKEAILDIGNFLKIFKNYGLDDKDIQIYTKEKIIKFITNTGYNVEDRKILINIFSLKGLITKKDIPAILERNDSDFTEEILDKCMTWNTDALTTPKSSISFVDPYELATFDPYDQRNFEKIPSTGKTRIIAEAVENIRNEIISTDDNYYKKDLEQAIEQIYQQAVEKEDAPLTVELMARVFFDLYKLNIEKLIKHFEKLEGFDAFQKAFIELKETHEKMLQEKAELEKQSETYLSNEQYQDALKTLTQMLEIDKHDENLKDIIKDVEQQRDKKMKILITKAKKEIFENKHEAANKTLNEALSVDSSNQEAKEYMDIIKDKFEEKISNALQNAKTAKEHKDFNKAEKAYMEVLKYDPNHQESLKMLQEIGQLKFSQKIDTWLEQIKVLVADQNFPWAKKEAKSVYQILTDAEDTEFIYDKQKIKTVFETIQKEKDKKIDTLIAQANEAQNNGQLEEAKTILEQAKKIETDFLNA